jgi:hypothetical protein
LTFTADGSVLADEPPLPGETTGHGNWVRGSHGEVSFTFVALYADPTGMYAGKLKVASTLQRDAGEDTWSGPFKITIFNASDQVTSTDTGTFELARIGRAAGLSTPAPRREPPCSRHSEDPAGGSGQDERSLDRSPRAGSWKEATMVIQVVKWDIHRIRYRPMESGSKQSSASLGCTRAGRASGVPARHRSSQAVSTHEFTDLAAWAAWYANEESQKLINDRRAFTMNEVSELWGPSPLVPAPIRPGE